MRKIGLFNKYKNKSQAVTKYKMVTDVGNGYYSWDGNVYQSDIVRACIRPKVKAVGKLLAKHLRNEYNKQGNVSLRVNPEPYMRFLLEEPNEFMSMQKLLEKVTTQLCLNNNAFVLVIRDENGYPVELYPIPASQAATEYIDSELYLKFYFSNGKRYTFKYTDIIHLRQDFYNNDIFGEDIASVLTPLMTVVTTTDQSIVNAIKNSSVIKWLLKFTTSLRPEDLQKQAADFATNFLEVEKGTGVVAIDSKVDAKQIDPKDFVPNAVQMEKTVQRIYSLFNTNDKIVQSRYTEDEWNAYYEAEVEPIVIDLNNEFTRKLFTRKERGFGNKVMFSSINLATASMSTKLGLVAMVDRGAMTPNEWRQVLGLAPVEGGDKTIRRLDTALVEGGETE